MTRSQIDKIGEKLRKAIAPDEELLERLQTFRGSYDATLTEVHARVVSTLAMEPTSRIKTINTIVEKLVRSKTRLSSMQDIAGVRIVLDEQEGLEDQDEAVKQLAAVFGESRVDDLRNHPRYGYRSVHVIVRVNGLPVEIQVRTKLQDRDEFEKLEQAIGEAEFKAEEHPEAAAPRLIRHRRASGGRWTNVGGLFRIRSCESEIFVLPL